MSAETLLQTFSSLLPPEQILHAQADLEFYGRDYCKDFPARPALVLQPKTAEEVAAIVRICGQEGLAIVPSGGRTGYSAGATAANGEIIISLSRLNRIHEINTVDRTLRCDAGVTTEMIQIKAREAGLFYPCDFASRGSSQIGGNVACNAGGIRVIRYGSTRDWVLGLKVVTPTGELLSLNGPLYKNQSGYDLKSLFIGSEGTLGIIVEVTLRLASAPLDYTLAICAIPALEESLKILQGLRQQQFTINLFEYFDRSCLEKVLKHNAGGRNPFAEAYDASLVIEIESPEASTRERFEECLAGMIEAGEIGDVVIAQSIQQEREIMSLREGISETLAKHYFPHKNDISVPIPAIPAFVRELRELLRLQYQGLDVLIFGHIGDGNLHINILKPENMAEAEFQKLCARADENTFSLIKKFAGSISAEHGVGLLKKPYLHFSRSPEELRLMRQIKQVLDPRGIMNPGKIFDV